jgi:hypothetical protein
MQMVGSQSGAFKGINRGAEATTLPKHHGRRSSKCDPFCFIVTKIRVFTAKNENI